MKNDLRNSIQSEGVLSAECRRTTAARRPYLRSADLFGGAREVVIEHAGEEYRLRLTRQGKLILTK
ncbi:MAG: hemin uptake protein HemP [Methylococcaceae bacterium]|nr:hemin uptake protein HemP [Methylococcaceae bacterium]